MKIESYNGEKALRIEFQSGRWSRSNFPDPLITADYDKDGNLLALTLVGPRIDELKRQLKEA